MHETARRFPIVPNILRGVPNTKFRHGHAGIKKRGRETSLYDWIVEG